jgi:hypothetical protein
MTGPATIPVAAPNPQVARASSGEGYNASIVTAPN